MKTTTMFRAMANPRRTTLAHLEDAEPLSEPGRETDAQAAQQQPIPPRQTANPRRTVLTKLPDTQ
jgi:hypothetical protein